MDFALNDDQTMLQDQLRTAFSRLSTLSRVREHVAAEGGFAEDVWAGLCDAGIPGLLVPERFGGLEMGLLDAALVAEELGRHTVPAPFVGPVVAAPLAIERAGSDEQRADLLPRIAAGELRIAVAVSEATAGARTGGGVTFRDGKLFGTSFFAVDVAGAHQILVADTDGGLHLVEVEARGLEITTLKTVDWTRSVATLTFDAVETAPLPRATPEVLAHIAAALRAVTAADLLGAATRMMEMAVDYAKVRQQFGRPIGSFQAVKHLCADMAAELEPGRALVWYAAHALDVGLADGLLCSLHAKSYMADASRLAARNATEVHGGIGITDELGLHFWFKRVSFGGQVFGGAQRMRELAMRGHLATAGEPTHWPVAERVPA
jgi:alkylation response protein AidB-like acyl-CoA dehydrogenase